MKIRQDGAELLRACASDIARQLTAHERNPMSALNLAGIAVGLAAMLGLAFGLPDNWFFGFLALAVMLGAVTEAYKEDTAGACGFLAASAIFAVLAATARWREQRAADRRTARARWGQLRRATRTDRGRGEER